MGDNISNYGKNMNAWFYYFQVAVIWRNKLGLSWAKLSTKLAS